MGHIASVYKEMCTTVAYGKRRDGLAFSALVFNALDTNGDGVIDFSEGILASSALRSGDDPWSDQATDRTYTFLQSQIAMALTIFTLECYSGFGMSIMMVLLHTKTPCFSFWH